MSKKKKKRTAFNIAKEFIEKKGHERYYGDVKGWAYLTPILEDYAGIKPIDDPSSAKIRGKIALQKLIDVGVIVESPVFKQKKAGQKKSGLQAFYRSYDWRKIRMQILQRDGRICACCNAKPEDGLVMHVDHIKPLRFNWELRLDPENLQVLCEVCNHGKGNWDETDWRPTKQ